MRATEVNTTHGTNGDGPTLTKHELRSRATRAAILEAAGQLFVENGFSNTSTERLVQMAGVTRGALYYQFEDKTDLFRAVVEDMAERVADEVREAMNGIRATTNDPWQAFLAGIRAFVRSHLRPDVRRVLGLEGPAVLGVKDYRAISRRFSYGILLDEVGALKKAGLLPDRPDEALAQLIAGGVRGATLYIVEAHHDGELGEAQITTASETLELMLEGLRTAAAAA